MKAVLVCVAAALAVIAHAQSSPECFACGAGLDGDDCFIKCGYCLTPALNFLDQSGVLCGAPAVPAHDVVVDTITAAILNTSRLQGLFFNDDVGNVEENATQSLAFLIGGMPRRDFMQLFEAPLAFSEFLIEHVRYALFAYHTYSMGLGVTWDDFLDAVLPYATLNEKRDVHFRWRPRMFATLMPLVRASNATTVLEAFRVVVAALPTLQLGGVYGLGPANQSFAPGAPVTWRSESSPARLSVQDTVAFGSSCTGTATTQALAARSVGLPARVEGCSESVVRGDDHHWTAVRSLDSPGPFGTFWHTREGSSAGNADGPWDAPSGPMLGCLQGVVPGSNIDTLWATSWGSRVDLPMLWANDATSATWARVGGINVCGSYCGAWGCGANNSQRWTQAQCGPAEL